MSKSPPFSLYVCCMYICGEHDVKHIVCWGCDEDDDSTLFTPKKFYYLFLYLYSVVGKTKISFFMTDGAGSNAHPFSDAHCTLMNSSWHMYLSTRCGKLFFTKLLLLPSLHRHRCDRIVCRRKWEWRFENRGPNVYAGYFILFFFSSSGKPFVMHSGSSIEVARIRHCVYSYPECTHIFIITYWN